MRALLTPFVQRELGIVILRPGNDVLPFMQGRLLVATEPEEFKSLPAGMLPVANQQLANDPRLLPFFEHDRVIRAAGGPRVLEAWVERLKECQWHDPDDNPNRLDVLFPPDYVNQLRVFAVLNQFRLQYNEEVA